MAKITNKAAAAAAERGTRTHEDRVPAAPKAPSLKAAKAAAKAPSKPVVTKAAPAAPANLFPAAVAAPAAPAAPVTVPLRGGIAVAAVVLTDKVYRCKAEHNNGWWATIQAKNGGPVADLVAAKVPARFVGYCIRRGYLAAAK